MKEPNDLNEIIKEIKASIKNIKLLNFIVVSKKNIDTPK